LDPLHPVSSILPFLYLALIILSEGGVEVGDVDAKALKILIAVNEQFPTRETLISTLLPHVPEAKRDVLADFLIRLYAVYVDLHCKSPKLNATND
jgi:ATP citrate (pro-S)-lyase